MKMDEKMIKDITDSIKEIAIIIKDELYESISRESEDKMQDVLNKMFRVKDKIDNPQYYEED